MANDGHFYVVKFRGNPQGDRTLINEWIATKLLRNLDILAPPLVFLAYDPSFLGESVSFTIEDREIPIEQGLHLGSPCPVNPEEQAIYDFLPPKLLEKTVNLKDFAGHAGSGYFCRSSRSSAGNLRQNTISTRASIPGPF